MARKKELNSFKYIEIEVNSHTVNKEFIIYCTINVKV